MDKNVIIDYIEKYKLVEKEDNIVVGVSGGGDSMLLLYILIEYMKIKPFKIVVVHINHNLRGLEAKRDENIVKDFCTKNKIPFKVYSYNIKKIAEEQKLTIEEAGRIARKEAFFKEGKSLGKNFKIALAHNKNDRAETFLYNLCRGTGLKGLCSISRQDNNIIRPLVELKKTDVYSLLNMYKIPFGEDSTNKTDHYNRNKLRNVVLPYLEANINSNTINHIIECQNVIANTVKLMEKQIENYYNYISGNDEFIFIKNEIFAMDKLQIIMLLSNSFDKYKIPRKDISSKHYDSIVELLKAQSGKSINLPNSLTAYRENKGIRIIRNKKYISSKKTKLKMNGKTDTSFGIFETRIFPYKDELIQPNKFIKWFDYDIIGKELWVREYEKDDTIIINEKGNSKKINRLFIDNKVPLVMRKRIPVIASDKVFWVVGYRISWEGKVTRETKNILEIRFKEEH